MYTNAAKTSLLGVPAALLEEKGAVSREVAEELARRVREKLDSDLGVGVTGLAGPDGDGEHEVGTVFISLADREQVWVREARLTGRGRGLVRHQACQEAFDMLRRYVSRPVRLRGRRGGMRLYLARHGRIRGHVRRLFYG